MQKEQSHEKFMNELGFVGLQLTYLTHISTSVSVRALAANKNNKRKSINNEFH
jgi:hypothetical protein